VLHLKKLLGEGTLGMLMLWTECRLSLKSDGTSEQFGSKG